MARLNRFLNQFLSTRASVLTSRKTMFAYEHNLWPLPINLLSQKSSVRFFDFYQLGNKEAIAKERARLTDEMNRGYFADIAELKEHGGKLATANKIIIPAMVAAKFPELEVSYSDGRTVKLPVATNGNMVDANNSAIPKASLLCLTFRANSQAMVNSWSVPFLDAYRDSSEVQLYEVSFIDSRLLCLSPIKWLLLRIMRKSKDGESKGTLERQNVYAFGDHYYFRKELKIMNLLTGYIFLIDKFGRVRWQGFGLSTKEELGSLLSCTSLLLQEN